MYTFKYAAFNSMSKNTNYKNEKEISKLLAEYKITIDEAQDWLGSKPAKQKPKKELRENSSPRTTNISFLPAQNTENTKVYVEDSIELKKIELTGVVRALLNYDPDLGFPILTLEIVNPKIM